MNVSVDIWGFSSLFSLYSSYYKEKYFDAPIRDFSIDCRSIIILWTFYVFHIAEMWL